MEQRKRGQFQEGFMLLIGLVLFALIGYSLLPIVANAQVASHGTNGTLVSNLSYAGQAINSLGPMIFAVSILLAIVTAGMSLFALFSR